MKLIEYISMIKEDIVFDVAVIFGSSQELNNVDFDKVDKEKILTIGINHSVLKYETNIHICNDSPDCFNVKHQYAFQKINSFKLYKENSFNFSDCQFSQIPDLWYNPYKFNDGLIIGSTLFSALHFCTLCNIENIYLAGIDYKSQFYFDNKTNTNHTDYRMIFDIVERFKLMKAVCYKTKFYICSKYSAFDGHIEYTDKYNLKNRIEFDE